MKWLVRRKLAKLQRAYYTRADHPSVIAYVDTLREARGPAVRRRALHAGAGQHYIDGWINVDFTLPGKIDAVANLAAGLPFRGDSLDYIHSEDFIEHVELADGKRFIAEAYRVLRRGGVMRILTPDLRALIERVYIDRERKHLRWCADTLAAPSPCQALNMHLRMSGEHRFIYDEELLTELLREVGFSVRRTSWNESKEPALRFLDLRNFGLSLFLEAVK